MESDQNKNEPDLARFCVLRDGSKFCKAENSLLLPSQVCDDRTLVYKILFFEEIHV